MRYRALACAALSALLASCATHEEVRGDPFAGVYEGTYRPEGRPPLAASATVVAHGEGRYVVEAVYVSQGPAPVRRRIELPGERGGGRIELEGVSAGTEWRGTIADGVIALRREPEHYGGVWKLKRARHPSPTLGAAPPEGAITLLEYGGDEPPATNAWSNDEWQSNADGSFGPAPGSGDNRTQQSFGDCALHLEFNLPHMPTARGQERANSGVYLQDRYEAQILDSFAVLTGSGDCGAIYEVSAPRENACRPPETWQTYDIAFTAPRRGSDGDGSVPARMTVYLNGVLVQDEVEVPGPTRGGADGAPAQAPLRLQDHGNRVRFRNIWLVEDAGALKTWLKATA